VVNADYIAWLRQLPVNRGTRRRSWVGIYSVDEGFEPYEAWQVRMSQRDAQRGVIARWLRWLQ